MSSHMECSTSLLASYLHSLLPTQQLAILLLHHENFNDFPLQMLKQPAEYISLHSGLLPSPASYPSVLSCELMELVICSQQLDRTTQNVPTDLTKSIASSGRRYVDAVSRYVTSQYRFVMSQHGLETLMLEGLYQVNSGDLQGCWLIFRRALEVAQLIGLDHEDQFGKDTSDFSWFRLVYGDRYLSLLLGVPYAATNKHFASQRALAADMARGECDDHYLYDDYKETQDIDVELQLATRQMFSEWRYPRWLKSTMLETDMRELKASLTAQSTHSYLLILLHVPYILRSLEVKARPVTLYDYTYNKLTAVAASRAVVSLCILLHDVNCKKYCCHGPNIKALIASMTLLLAHLEGHDFNDSNMLKHQRLHDVGMVNDITKITEQPSYSNKDMVSSSFVQAIKGLLTIEARAANGARYSVQVEGKATGNAYWGVF
ncbi:conserved hypothetical protein [Talaromyces stipitatus ATCC 10500]|uniref:Transcription factor domain-containing protein n=1 Tax=Talaromyces stipitatus (strain ATCC 10500 / CBS 375.48 / QM 6759 / NRRL 1006) TaxID=441959 RepID=B8MN46_TALSN|nr:uncharacterized protein TSTA_102250 [Talaromyces stipitatus ATCC 10500]EED13995.1 conserved hypothetical protein [Talaromyces stipitatus ATCC 10500]